PGRRRRRVRLRHAAPAAPGRRPGLVRGRLRRGSAPQVLLPDRGRARAHGAFGERVVHGDAGHGRPARWEEWDRAMTAHDDVDRYAAGVRAALVDLGPEARAHLLEALEARLREVASEPDVSLVERLGPPEAYAAELRAAYGAPTSGGRTPA